MTIKKILLARKACFKEGINLKKCESERKLFFMFVSKVRKG